jgi:uncharacterized protein YneF (UPF0154 family)
MSLAQSHVIKASSLLTPKIMSEITEDNPRLTDDLRTALNQLKNMPSPSENQIKSVSQLVNDLHFFPNISITFFAATKDDAGF